MMIFADQVMLYYNYIQHLKGAKKMEHLEIQNFSVIKKADFEVKRMNLLIGPQATGKSVVAKLLYFFQRFLYHTFPVSIRERVNKPGVVKNGENDFTRLFPKYIWSNQEFCINYRFDKLELSVRNIKNGNGGYSLKFDYSKNLTTTYNKLKREYQKEIDNVHKSKSNITENDIFINTFIEKYFEYAGLLYVPFFVPAGRSFFSTIQKNMFSILSKGVDIDEFIIEFGAQYEGFKNNLTLHSTKNELDEKLIKITNNILCGEYKYKNDEDWIVQEGKEINIFNSSSGQQEALPMLLTLMHFQSLQTNKFIIIEEPEGHLFPVAQKDIVSLLGLIYNRKGNYNNFLLTTHSPYILTALNNLLLAHDTIKSHGEKKVKKIIDPDSAIDFDDMSAYTMKNGVLKSILDKDTRLIGSSVIDSVSDDFAKSFDSLIELQMEKPE